MRYVYGLQAQESRVLVRIVEIDILSQHSAGQAERL